MTGIGIPPLDPGISGGDGSIWPGIVAAIVLLVGSLRPSGRTSGIAPPTRTGIGAGPSFPRQPERPPVASGVLSGLLTAARIRAGDPAREQDPARRDDCRREAEQPSGPGERRGRRYR